MSYAPGLRLLRVSCSTAWEGCVLSLAPEVVCERCESRKIATAAGAAVISVKTINALAALHPTRAYSAKKLPRPLTGLVELVQNRLPWLP